MDQRQQAALARVHAELHELLEDAVRVLNEENLPYSVMCGTLLGAIRHQGIIPWDDDVDLVLPRESFKQFAKIYPIRCAEGFGLDLSDTWVPRVRKAGGGKNAFIDLFILDPLPDGKWARGWKLLRLKTLQGMLKDHTDYSRFSLGRRALLWGTDLLGKPFSKQQKLLSYDRIARGGSSKSSSVHMANAAFHLLGVPFAPEVFDELEDANFDGLTVRVPRDWEAVLTRLYGSDYMTPPPEEKRVPVHLEM